MKLLLAVWDGDQHYENRQTNTVLFQITMFRWFCWIEKKQKNKSQLRFNLQKKTLDHCLDDLIGNEERSRYSDGLFIYQIIKHIILRISEIYLLIWWLLYQNKDFPICRWPKFCCGARLLTFVTLVQKGLFYPTKDINIKFSILKI